MKKIANLAAYVFILSVVFLSAISILGIWDFFEGDVVSKSFLSIGLLSVVAGIVLIADHLSGNKDATPVSAPVAPMTPNLAGEGAGIPQQPIPQPMPQIQNPSASTFRSLRVFTLIILITSVSLLALFGVMAIWEIVAGEVLHKSLSSIAIVAFASLIIVLVCLEREGNREIKNRSFSAGSLILFVIFGFIALRIIAFFF